MKLPRKKIRIIKIIIIYVMFTIQNELPCMLKTVFNVDSAVNCIYIISEKREKT